MPDYRELKAGCYTSAEPLQGLLQSTMKVHTIGVLRQYAAAVSAALSVFIVGTWISWPSSAVKYILGGESELDISPDEVSWVVALLDLGNMISPIPSSYISNWLGRKPTLIVLSISFLISSILVIFGTNVYYLYIARTLVGIGKGLAFTVVPIYLGEIAGTKVRGSIGTLFLGMMNYGILFELCIGPLVSYDTLNIISLPFPILFFLLFFRLPESPYYLLMEGRLSEAQKSLSWFRNLDEDSTTLQNELKLIATNVDEDMKQKGSYKDLINTASARKATFIVMGLASLQRLTGATCITAYSTTTLPPSGGYFSPQVYMVFFGITMIIGQVICGTLVDIFGRKPLLILSGLGCAASTGVIALFYWLNESRDATAFNWVPYLGVILYGIMFSVGLGTIPPIISAELYPANVRSYAAAVAAICYAVSSFVINKLYLHVKLTIGIHFMYLFFSVCSVLCVFFTCTLIFETSGLTFLEIQTTLKRKSTYKSTECCDQ